MYTCRYKDIKMCNNNMEPKQTMTNYKIWVWLCAVNKI